MVAFAGVVGWSFPLVATAFRICAGFEKQSSQFFLARRGGLMQGSVPTRLLHIHVCALGDENAHRFQILAQSNTSVQWLVVHGIARETMQMGPVS